MIAKWMCEKFLLLVVLCGLFLANASFVVQAVAGDKGKVEECVPPSQWMDPADKKIIDPSGFLRNAAQQQVVLLGEHHDQAEHHRWQLQTLAALHTLHPNMGIGFEMFSRRVQPVLDRWVVGELSEEDFLQQSEWKKQWNFAPALYMPLFHFARMNHVPIYALNVERSLIQKVGKEGWGAVPEAEREGVTDPAPPSEEYVQLLASVYSQHGHAKDGESERTEKEVMDDPAFRRFTQGQTLWDAAMAQGLSAQLARDDKRLMVGIVGSGHIVNGFGIPEQLAAQGIEKVVTMVAWHSDYTCEALQPGFADVVVGMVQSAEQPDEAKPRLGVYLEAHAKGVRIAKVIDGSVAQVSGLRQGDIVIKIAGRAAKQVDDVIAAVKNMLPGTWLPMTVMRAERSLEVVAKFPAQP
ncbi:MAG: PDZ domain-containing protein [Gammaproteobacteria bacterium]|nr:PDZ domain-containing protein [Gammaproteobacteria bacterium]